MTLPLPRYVIAKQLASGTTAFYFTVPTRYRKMGCTIPNEPLGNDYSVACGPDGKGGRAAALNGLFDEWWKIKNGEPVDGMLSAAVRGLQRDRPVAEGGPDLDDGAPVAGAHPLKRDHRPVHADGESVGVKERQGQHQPGKQHQDHRQHQDQVNGGAGWADGTPSPAQQPPQASWKIPRRAEGARCRLD